MHRGLMLMWGLVSPLLAPTMRKSIKFLAKEDMGDLLEVAEAEELPQWCFDVSPALRAAAAEAEEAEQRRRATE